MNDQITEFIRGQRLGHELCSLGGIDPFLLVEDDGVGAALEWAEEVDTEAARIAHSEHPAETRALAALAGYLVNVELAAELDGQGLGDLAEEALGRAASHAAAAPAIIRAARREAGAR